MKDRRFHPVAPLLLADSTSRQRHFVALVVVVVVGALLVFLLAVSSSLQRQFAAALFVRRGRITKVLAWRIKDSGKFRLQ
jgi:hypothetical protein